jgi:hypothetical protein
VRARYFARLLAGVTPLLLVMPFDEPIRQAVPSSRADTVATEESPRFHSGSIRDAALLIKMRYISALALNPPPVPAKRDEEEQMSLRSRLYAIGFIVTLSSVPAYAQFTTWARIQCVGQSSAVARIEVFQEDGPPVVYEARCSDGGGGATGQIVALTSSEAVGWRITANVEGPTNHGEYAYLLCGDATGTRFPAVYHCGREDLRVQLTVFVR